MIDNELVAQIAKAIQVKTGGNVEGKIPEWWAELIGMALAELQSAGRLIPAGGMALTAEQVEDVRAVLAADVTLTDHSVYRAWLRLRALFPATEPSDRCKKWTVRVAGGIETGIQCVLPTGHESFHDYVPPIHNYVQPAPVEPAEEETKAEYPHRGLGDLTVLGPEIFTNGEVINWRGENFVRQQDEGICSAKFDGDRVYRCALAAGHYGDHTTAKGEHWQKRPASSPVVPAPTETGPWQTWQEVPEGVKYKSSKSFSSAVWFNQDHNRYASTPDGERHLSGVDDSKMNTHLAPFVAAEEG